MTKACVQFIREVTSGSRCDGQGAQRREGGKDRKKTLLWPLLQMSDALIQWDFLGNLMKFGVCQRMKGKYLSMGTPGVVHV